MSLFSWPIRVRYCETDAMGIVWHGSYTAWLEESRVRFLDSLGLSYREMEAEGYLMAVLELNLKYERSAFFDDALEVRLSVKERPGVRLRLDYEIWRGETRLAQAWTLHAFIDRQGVPIKPHPAFLNRVRQLWAEQNAGSEAPLT